LKGKKIKEGMRPWIVPGSAARAGHKPEEGSLAISSRRWFDGGVAGCSMCLAMTLDQLAPGRTLRIDIQPQLRKAVRGLRGAPTFDVTRDWLPRASAPPDV